MKVLLAEDDATSRMMLRMLLTRWGYEVIEVNDGDAAWSELQRSDGPKLALLDWMMPGLDGPSVCRLIGGLQSSRPPYVILVTGRTETSDIVDGLNAGANDYVSKPYVAAELRARIEVGRRMVELQEKLQLAMETLSHQAVTDSLTSVLNRGAIIERLEGELASERADGSTIWVSMLDLDHFKLVNDQFGHLAGDEVLRVCSRRIRSICGPTAWVGRYGGEEFLIVVRGRTSDLPPAEFERIRAAIADESISFSGHQIRQTVSQGISEWDGRGGMDDLIREADDALYLAKDAGRNVVVRHEPAVGRGGSR